MSVKNNTRRHCKSNRRTAALTVEMALTLGVAIMFFFAAFEFCRVAMIRHTVDNAVYEGARRGIVPGATVADVENTTQRVLNTIGLRTSTISVSPSELTNTTPVISVRVQVPVAPNLFAPAVFFSGRSFDRTLQLRREVTNVGT